MFLENDQVVAAEANDPILVDYEKKIGNDPTGKEHPELLKMHSSPGQGHNQTIVNGIGRIGYMSGGTRARWVDEEVSTTFLHKAQDFISQHQNKPFFLYFCLTEPQVPRMPATQFKGKSKLGYRGDAILQLDWTVGQIQQQLQLLGLDKNAIIIFSSDNGPVLDDGYMDGAVAQQNGHLPAGPLRGGKYSIFEGGTRVPFIVSGKGVAQGKVSNALISQIDLLATSAQLLDVPLKADEAKDSAPLLKTLTGQDNKGRSSMVQHAQTLAIVKDEWKYIAPSKGAPYMKLTDTETGSLPEDQLYDLKNDIGEKNNVASKYPEKVAELKQLLEGERKK
ncbi:sulfatase-like hydrolase/transferase [Sphingobacterium multivorum]|uniref:sulfatase-like hydrolase/transferase n=1 Tax=Sphingobacterium multivorum TaxID=28454 RepID=UPI002FDB8D10